MDGAATGSDREQKQKSGGLAEAGSEKAPEASVWSIRRAPGSAVGNACRWDVNRANKKMHG